MNTTYIHIILLSNKEHEPLSHKVKVKSAEDYQQNKAQYQEQAILSLCKNRGLTPQQLKQYGYNSCVVNLVIKEDIEDEDL